MTRISAGKALWRAITCKCKLHYNNLHRRLDWGMLTDEEFRKKKGAVKNIWTWEIKQQGKRQKGRTIPVNRPWRPIELWDVEATTFSLDSRLTVGNKAVSLTRRRPPPPPWRFLVLVYFRGWVDLRAIVRLEELGKLKKKIHLIGTRTRKK
jgi:hypothetical protein